MAVARFLVCLACFLVVDGARISASHAAVQSAVKVVPDGEVWAKGTKYVCMQKWELAKADFTNDFCLANYAKADEIATAHFKPKGLESCASTKLTYKMKLCALKGDAPDGRVSYSTKVYVPKSCFRLSSDDAALSVIEAAVDEPDCKKTISSSKEEQGVIQAKLATTTTTTTTTTMTEVLLEEEFDDELEEIEAKALFIAGDEKLWDFYGKAFKCCISTSAGKPAKLQDMMAEKLPAVRTLGRRDGCGMMFGDTYHNGPKHYNKCPILLSTLKEITEEDFKTIKGYLKA